MRVFEVRSSTWRQRAASMVLGGVALLLAVAYVDPALSIPRYQISGRVSIVSYIDRGGPWWVAGFGITGLAIVAGLLTSRALALVHTVGAGVSASFATAIWFGALTSDPPGPFVSAVMASGYCFLHWVLADSYRGRG
jgi:hypothetical protein